MSVRKKALTVFVCAAAFSGVATRPVGAADVQVNIGVPAPPVLSVQPPLVAVPAAPQVRYAPEVPYDMFYYGGQYYAYRDGWFRAPKVGQPWVFVQRDSVPQPVLILPGKPYKKVPPGHLKHRNKGHKHDID